ncbi:hypothetical protein Tco_0350972, partial [Tanacetum coccineum]
TAQQKVSTDRPIVSTDGSKVSTDKEKDSTDEQNEGTDDQAKGTDDHTEGGWATQTTQTPTSIGSAEDERLIKKMNEKGIDSTTLKVKYSMRKVKKKFMRKVKKKFIRKVKKKFMRRLKKKKVPEKENLVLGKR